MRETNFYFHSIGHILEYHKPITWWKCDKIINEHSQIVCTSGYVRRPYSF